MFLRGINFQPFCFFASGTSWLGWPQGETAGSGSDAPLKGCQTSSQGICLKKALAHSCFNYTWTWTCLQGVLLPPLDQEQAGGRRGRAPMQCLRVAYTESLSTYDKQVFVHITWWWDKWNTFSAHEHNIQVQSLKFKASKKNFYKEGPFRTEGVLEYFDAVVTWNYTIN